MSSTFDQPPLVLCVKSEAGGEVTVCVEPQDDFQTFLHKAKAALGYDVDINSITNNQPAALTDNIYQFLLSSESWLTVDTAAQPDTDFDPANPGDLLYILDDGTEIKSSQITFDNEDPLLDLTAEKIPFVKYKEDEDDEPNNDSVETKDYNIVDSPVSQLSDSNVSFISTLPFKLVCTDVEGFNSQFTKYLEESNAKTYATLNPVATDKSPRSLIRENFKKYDDRNPEDFSTFTREQVLNMFKDPPAAATPSSSYFEKRRHVRKTDPSRPGHRWNSNFVNIDGAFICHSTSQDCFICGKFVDTEKLYLFDNEDQKMHRSSSPKKVTTELKIICEQCLDGNFKPLRMKNPNQNLNSDEYLVIRNNQQYIFQKANPGSFKSTIGQAKAIIDKIETQIFKKKEKEELEFVKVEIGSDGEIVTKPVEVESDDVILIKDDKDEGSSDVEIIEPGPEIDEAVIENLDDADEDVKVFLGKYQSDEKYVKELKCRFCGLVFTELQQVVEHGAEHRHELEDGQVFPCPLCDYGYARFIWLKGHLKAAHDKVKLENEKLEDDVKTETQEPAKDIPGSPEGFIAQRTRSAARRQGQGVVAAPSATTATSATTTSATAVTSAAAATSDVATTSAAAATSDVATTSVAAATSDVAATSDAIVTSSTTVSSSTTTTATSTVNSNGSEARLTLKTEVKQEALDTSDEEAIWILQATEDDKGGEQEVQTKQDEKSSTDCVFSAARGGAARGGARRGRKRKPGGDADTRIHVPTREDFIKRAQGRPRLSHTADKDVGKKKSEPSSDPQILTCNDCNESFTSKVRLKFHMQFHGGGEGGGTGGPGDRGYLCARCGRRVPTEAQLFDHVHFQHHRHKRWQCPVKDCGKTFYLRATLTKHSRTHTDTRRYVCVTCGKRFLDKQTLDEHGVTHLQMKPFQCHICMKQLTRRSRLRMHLRAHEAELRPVLVLVCAACHRAFRDHADAEEHVSKSTECVEIFANTLKEEVEEDAVQLSPTSGLVRPVEKPDGTKGGGGAWVLHEVRDARAAARLQPLQHVAHAHLLRVVEVDRAFRCEYCEDVFYLPEGLNKHRAVHKGVKNPFICHICKVSFATYSRCTTHKTTHGFYKRSLEDAKRRAASPRAAGGPSAAGILGYGGFPVVKHFLCEECGRSYLHWTYLQVHRRMKHPAQDYHYKCNHCQLTFPNTWSVTYHRKKVHGRCGPEDGGVTKVPKENHRIPCRDCEAVVGSKSALYRHRRDQHSGALSPHGAAGAGGRTSSRSENSFARCLRGARASRPRPLHLAVIEMSGASPSAGAVRRRLAALSPPRRLLHLALLSYTKGVSGMVPNSLRALSVLTNAGSVRAASSIEGLGSLGAVGGAGTVVVGQPRSRPAILRAPHTHTASGVEGANLRAGFSGALLPREGALQPRERALLPREGAFLPRENAPLPREAALLPREDALLPRNALFPPEGVLFPPEGIIFPPEGVLFPPGLPQEYILPQEAPPEVDLDQL